MALTLKQKQKVIELRNTRYSYNKIAKILIITRDQVRDFCRTETAIEMGLVYEYKRKPRNQYKCKYCNKKYIKEDSDIKSIHYCSRECKEKENEKRKQETILEKTKQCKKCGNDFVAHSNLQEYCSKECRTIILVCKQCGKEFKRINRESARGQKYCSNKCEGEAKSESHEAYYKRFSEIHKGHIVPIEKYTRADDELTVFCLDCGKETTRRAHKYVTGRKSGCKHCGKVCSTGELRIEEWLKENNINYLTQYSFDDLVVEQPLRFDFAILDNDNNLKHLIEYDGIQHYEPRKQFGGKVFLEEQRTKDSMKSEYALVNHIPLLRINYKQKEDIENILEEKLIS